MLRYEDFNRRGLEKVANIRRIYRRELLSIAALHPLSVDEQAQRLLVFPAIRGS